MNDGGDGIDGGDGGDGGAELELRLLGSRSHVSLPPPRAIPMPTQLLADASQPA